MAETLLESSAISAFCGSIATMLSAGIQTDEAVLMLAENREESQFKTVCDTVYQGLISGKTLSESMDDTKAFPDYAVNMVATGEQTGRTENVLRSLDLYYDEENRLFEKLRLSVGYPAALLCIMAVILAFTVIFILPVFLNVYKSMTGSLTTGSYGFVNISLVIGWAAFAIVLLGAIAALYLVFSCRNQEGRQRVIALLEKVPFTRDAMYQLALSRFTVALSTHVSSGINNEDAMQKAIETVTHPQLKKRLEKAHETMVDVNEPRSLAQAISDNDIFEPLYARMLQVGVRSGSTDKVLSRLSQIFFADAVVQIDQIIDRVEPALAAFLTVAVGATLVSVMLPLIGIMGSIV